MEVFNEYNLVKRHLSRFVAENKSWPSSLNEANFLSSERLLKFNLTEPWALKAKINQKALRQELRGRQIKFILDPKSNLWSCDSTFTNLPKAFSPEHCDGELNQIISNISPKKWSVFIAVMSLIIIALLATYRHPLLKKIRKYNFSLTKVSFFELKKLNFLALITGHRKPLLKANNLTLFDWQRMLHNKRSTNQNLIKTLQQTLPIKDIKTESKALYRLSLSDQFELNITELLIYVINEANTHHIINRINQMADQPVPILIWINHPEANIELRSQRHRINKPCLIPTQQQMTQLLMYDSGKTTLIRLAVSHLPLNSVSPYQGAGGIIKSSHFFGRQAILDKLEAQFQSNFLLVGGRQLGKTSLLKALFRKLKQQPDNHCLYISLSDDRLLPRLAYHSGIKQFNHLDDLLTQIKQNHPGKKIRLLIDESDLFIQTEVKNNFQLLNQIRQSAEYGQCQFIFAGFWDLYATAVLDYHSPLRNLAEPITVGALETKPAYQLISQPMAILGQQFASTKLIEDIYMNTGGRANLINLVCEYLIEQLTVQKKIIDSVLVEQAYQSDRVLDALQGWSNLSADAEACSIDRIIVYMTYLHQQIDLKKINQIFNHHHIIFSPEQLKQSIQRLRLAHIIIKCKNQYCFAVPLFSQQHDSEEAKVLIKQEIQHLKS